MPTITADVYTIALERLINKSQEALVLFPHTYRTRDFAPKLATRFGNVLVSDTIAARVEDGSVVLVRQLFQGKLNGEVRLTSRPRTVRVRSSQAGA